MKKIVSIALMVLMLAGLAPAAAAYGAEERSALMQTVMGYVSDIDAEMKAALRETLAVGKEKGLKEGLMAQWGDSITYTSAYLDSWYGARSSTAVTEDGHNYAPILEWMAGDKKSLGFKGADYANYSGWRAMTVYNALPQAINRLKPSWAHLMIGTNDLGSTDIADYTKKMREIITRAKDAGVILTLSTIPPIAGDRNEQVPYFNNMIVSLAKEYKLPYVDLWGLYMAICPDDWEAVLLGDGVHPSFTGDLASVQKDETLMKNGYMLRSVLTAELAEKMKAIVFEDGKPDGAGTTLSGILQGTADATGASIVFTSKDDASKQYTAAIEGNRYTVDLPKGTYSLKAQCEGLIGMTADAIVVQGSVMTYPISLRAGDINGDGSIDAADLNLLLAAMDGDAAEGCDITGDGRVNAVDLGLMLNNLDRE